jgi:hypothetical protein
MKDIIALDFYTEVEEPLMTQHEVRFFFKYENVGESDVEAIPAEIIMGDIARPVTLPGVSPNETKVVEMVLTNNISDELSVVGVRLGPDPDQAVLKKFSWMGTVDLQVGNLKRFKAKDTEREVFYKVYIHNKGTRRAKDVSIIIEKDNDFYGSVDIGILAAKTSKNINLGMDRRKNGLFKLTVSAKAKSSTSTIASRSFHVQVEEEAEGEHAGKENA